MKKRLGMDFILRKEKGQWGRNIGHKINCESII